MSSKTWKRLQIFSVLFHSWITTVYPAPQSASFTCFEHATDPDAVEIEFRLHVHQDTVWRVYAYDASASDLSSATKLTDCYQDTSGVTDVDTTPITFTIVVNFTTEAQVSPADDCGVSVTTLTEFNTKVAKARFRSQAFENLVADSDRFYDITCRADTLTGQSTASPGVPAGSIDKVVVVEPQKEVVLLLLDETSRAPLSMGTLGQRTFLSIEFEPGFNGKGRDNYGEHFFIGFLGNDPDSGASNAELYIYVVPRFSLSTHIVVSSQYGSQSATVSSTDPVRFDLSPDLLSCTDGGNADIGDNGVEITATREVAVLVYNVETSSQGWYTALPLDVLGTEHYTVSWMATGKVAELLVIATENDTVVTVTLPDSASDVTYNTTYTGGSSIQVMLDKRQTFHLAQESESVNGYHIVSSNPVAVISGNRLVNVNDDSFSDHIVDQIPPTVTLGDEYFLPHAEHNSNDARITDFIVMAVEDGSTEVTHFASGVEQTETISSAGDHITLTVTSGVSHLQATKRVLVVQIVNSPDSNGGTDGIFDAAMTVMPSVIQFSPTYQIETREQTSFVGVLKAADESYFTVNNAGISPVTAPVTGAPDYLYFRLQNFSPRSYTLSMSKENTTLMVLAYSGTNLVGEGMTRHPLGYRYPDQNETCIAIPGFKGDLIDNDCDGLIDEEDDNGIDDDGDGETDEDPFASATEFLNPVAVRPINCRASKDSTFETIVQITGDDGCRVGTDGDPFYPESECTISSTSTSTRKIVDCGVFKLLRFESSLAVYFKCDLEFCYNASDPLCTTDICSPGGVSKRETAEKRPSASTSVLVNNNSGGSTDSIGGSDSTEVKAVKCLQNTYFLIVFIIMLLLLFFSLAVTMCFYIQLRRQRRKKDSNRR